MTRVSSRQSVSGRGMRGLCWLAHRSCPSVSGREMCECCRFDSSLSGAAASDDSCIVIARACQVVGCAASAGSRIARPARASLVVRRVSATGLTRACRVLRRPMVLRACHVRLPSAPPLERVGAVCKLTLKLLLSSPLLERVEATGGRMLKLLPLPPPLVSARRLAPAGSHIALARACLVVRCVSAAARAHRDGGWLAEHAHGGLAAAAGRAVAAAARAH